MPDSVQVAIGLYQGVLVALSLLLGAVQYAIKKFNDDDSSVDNTVVFTAAVGYMSLNHALSKLSSHISENSSSEALSSALDSIDIFVIFLGVSLMYTLIKETEFANERRNIVRLTLALTGGLAMYFFGTIALAIRGLF